MNRRLLLGRLRKPALTVALGVVFYLIATNTGAGWLYVISAAVAGVILVSAAAPTWNVRRIEVARRAPAFATAGEPLECTLEIRNTGRLARHLLELEDRFAGSAGRAVLPRLAPGRPETIRYALEDPRRGVYSGGEVAVESGAPFGLFYRRRRLRAASDLVVYPRTFEVAGLPPSATVDAERADRSESPTLHRGAGGEFWGIREYRPGDPARLVAWKRSARTLATGKLAVLELAQETHPPLKVVMDLDPRAPADARETVVSAGASLLLFGLQEGREVRADAGPQKHPFPDEVTPDAVLAWCAHLQPGRPPDPEGASVEVRPSTRRDGAGRRARQSAPPVASEAQVVVLVSCCEFAGPAVAWMSPAEEAEFVEAAGAGGRKALRLGVGVEEPWRI